MICSKVLRKDGDRRKERLVQDFYVQNRKYCMTKGDSYDIMFPVEKKERNGICFLEVL